MSASPPPPPRARRSWLRRAVRVLVGLTLALAALGVSGLVLLHSPPGRTAARVLFEAWGSRATGGTLRIGQLELALWKGHAAATAVTLALPGATIEAQRIELDWSPAERPRLAVLRPRLVVTARKDDAPSATSATGLEARPWRVLERLGRAQIVEGRLELRDVAGAPWLVLGRVDMEMKESTERVAFRIADAALGWPEGGLRVEGASAEGALRLEDGRLTVERARLSAGDASLELEGGLQRILPTTATASARASFDGTLVGALAPGAELEGRVELESVLDVQENHLTGTLASSSRALRVAGVGPWKATGRGRLDGNQLAVESLAAEGLGGRLEASGSLALAASARTDLKLVASGFDVLALTRALRRDVPGTPQAPLAARASGSLRFTTRGFDLAAARGEGQLSLQAGTGPGLKPTASAGLRLRGRTLTIADARVEARGARVTGDAELGPGGALRGRFAAELPLAALRELMADAGRAVPAAVIDGRLLAEGEIGGSLSEPRLAAHARGDGLAVRAAPFSLQVELVYQHEALELAPLVLRSGSGQATVTGKVPLAHADAWDLAGNVDSLDIAPALALAGLDGNGPATGSVRVTGPRDEPHARVSLHADAHLGRSDGSAPGEDEVTVELAGEGVGQRLRLERLEARLAGGRVSGTARYDASTGALAASLEAEGVAWERLPLVPAPARRIAGTLAGRLTLDGQAAAPVGELALRLAEPRLDGSPLLPLALSARSDGHELQLSATSGTAEVVRGTGQLQGDWPVRLVVDAKALPYTALVDAIPALKQAGGEVAGSGSLSVELPLRAPARLRYASPDLAFSGRVRRLEWRIAPFSLRGSSDSLEVSGLKLEAGNAWLTARGRAGLGAASPFDLELEARLDLEALASALAVRSLGGSGALKLHVGGTRESPQLQGELTLAKAHGRLERARFTDLDAEARFEGRELRVERLQAGVLGGTLTASGGVALLGSDRGAAPPRVAFALKDVDLAQLLDRELRETADSPSLFVSLDGELSVDASSLAQASGRGRLTRLDSASVEGALALEAPAAWTLQAGRFEIEPVRLKGPLGALEARIRGGSSGTGPTAEATLAGQIDLRVVSPFLSDTSVSGPAALDVRATYAQGAMRIDGSAKLEKGRLSLDALNFATSDLVGELRFEGDRVTVEASASAADGKLRANGGLTLAGARHGAADIELTAERVPISYPAGFRGRASGALRLSGEPGRYRLTGAVDVRQSFYSADFDAKSQSLDRLDWQLAELGGGSLGDQVALAVDVRLAEPLRIRNATMRADLEGALVASGTLAQPTAEGVVSLREGGELTLGRARVRVSEGRLTLNGYPAGTPDIDFQGATSVSGVPFQIRARGAIDDLQLTLDSDRSDLTQNDLLTLLLTGRTAGDAASKGGVVVAEQLAVALGGVLQRGVGDTLLIDVAPDRSLLTQDTDPTQRIHVGTRITQNVTVLYSVALDGTEQRWIVELNPGGGRFRVRGITEEDNTFSIEGSDRFSFDLWNRGRRPGTAPRELERLASLRFSGALPVSEEELRRAAKLKPRRRCSGLQREQAADRVRARLVRAGYRTASVETGSHPGEGGVDLVLSVDAGPLVHFAWTGDDPGGKLRQQAEQAYGGVAAPEVAAAQVARLVQHRLQANGYYGASVEARTSSGEGQVEVALLVARGTKGSRVDVEFEGNKALGDAALLAALPKPGSLAFFEALDPRTARISSSLRLAYAAIGHLRVRVSPPRSSFDAASGRLVVTILVRERSASTVTLIALPEEVGQPGAPPLELKLRQGQPFDLSAYVADRDALIAWYRAQGWLDAQGGASLEPRGGSVAVRYEIDKGPRPRVGSVRVVDAGNTRSSLIRRSLKLREGDYLKPTALAESRERLSDLGIYRSVDVRTKPRPPGDELRDVEVGLVPKPDVQVEYGLRYSTSGDAGASGSAPTAPSNSHIQAALAVELNSPFGYGVKTRGYTFLTTDRQTWGVNLDAPALLGWRVRTQLFVFDDNEGNAFLLAGIYSRVRGVTLQQSQVVLRDRRSRRWHDRLRLQWGYSFKNIEYFGSEPGVVQLHGYRGFLTLALIGDERDSLTDPSRGIFWTATSELARTWLGSDVDYVRLYGQLFAFVPIGKLVWAQGLRVGAVPGENALALLENRFRAGGSTTVRGFEQNALGPLSPAGGSLGGQAVVVANEELRFPIYKSLKGGLFWDAGNVWAFSRELDFKDLRQSLGFGLRYMFPFGPLRLEYAWILDRQPGEAKGRFVFGLGHAF